MFTSRGVEDNDYLLYRGLCHNRRGRTPIHTPIYKAKLIEDTELIILVAVLIGMRLLSTLIRVKLEIIEYSNSYR